MYTFCLQNVYLYTSTRLLPSCHISYLTYSYISMMQHSMVSQSLHLLIDPAHTVSVTEGDKVKLQSMLSLPRIFLRITLRTPSIA